MGCDFESLKASSGVFPIADEENFLSKHFRVWIDNLNTKKRGVRNKLIYENVLLNIQA